MKTFYQNAVILGLVVLCIYLFRQNNYNQKTAKNNIGVLTDSIGYFKTREGLWGAEKRVFIGTQKQLKQLVNQQSLAFRNALKSFKKPSSAAVIKTETKIDTVFIPYEKEIETIIAEFNLPFSKKTKFYSINGSATNQGLNILNITIPNTQTVVFGKKRIGFLKNEHRIEVVNSNPLIKTTYLDGLIYKPKKHRFGIGFFLGYSMDLKPTIGFGLSYNTIKF